MEIKTYRAKSLQEALRWIRSDLGPDAAVLHTREVRSGWLGWLSGPRYEVTAGLGVRVPSRFPDESLVSQESTRGESQSNRGSMPGGNTRSGTAVPSAEDELGAGSGITDEPTEDNEIRDSYRGGIRQREQSSLSPVEETSLRATPEVDELEPPGRSSAALDQLFAELMDAEMDEDSAWELIRRLRDRSSSADWLDYTRLKVRLTRMIEDEIHCAGPLRLVRGKRRVVALVGPTGVGKTTTVAKLAGELQLRQQKRVGLVTIDTYRVAAVEQLRTYAEIIDLLLEVVATPREMHAALEKLSSQDLILIDTAGHSPADESRLQDLASLLQESGADEVHLVLSGVSSISSLKRAIARFGVLGPTRLIVTKLDEMVGLGHLWPLLRDGRLPLSYVTHGQNVPDDLAPADARQLARQLLNRNGGQ